MDIFRFNNPTNVTKMEQGEIINGFKSKMWIERYREKGEFELIADEHSGAREALEIGSFISHIDTTEVMIVEDHQIQDDRNKETDIKITGRSFESFLGHRVVGAKRTFPVLTGTLDYSLASNTARHQIRELIRNHIDPDVAGVGNDALSFVDTNTDAAGSDPVLGERLIKLGDLYLRVIENLEAYGLGIKSVRPGPWKHPDTPTDHLGLVIYKGVDRSNSIVFSYDTGEIKSADYLWSNQKAKGCALVFGRWISVRVDMGGSGYDKRMLYVDASSLDSSYSSAPTEPDRSDIIAQMEKRGEEAIETHNDIVLTRPEVSQQGARAKYRTDYNVGDLIMVQGSYNETAPMVVSEYVEIEDENGAIGYPTLSVS